MPRLPSPAQIEAARRNGARSHGPTSACGKAASAKNALRHGLCARTVKVLSTEDPDAYQRLRTALIERCAQDDDPLRVCMAELLADNVWRQFRLSRQETAQHAQLLAIAQAREMAHPESVALLDHQQLLHLARYRGQQLREFKELLAALNGPLPPAEPEMAELPEMPAMPEMPGRLFPGDDAAEMLARSPVDWRRPWAHVADLRNEPDENEEEPDDEDEEDEEPDAGRPDCGERPRAGEPDLRNEPEDAAQDAREDAMTRPARAALAELAALRARIRQRWPAALHGEVEAFVLDRGEDRQGPPAWVADLPAGAAQAA